MMQSPLHPVHNNIEVAVWDTVDGAVAARAKHNKVGNLRDPTLFGLGQRNSVMGLDDFYAVDLERLDATGLAEELTARWPWQRLP